MIEHTAEASPLTAQAAGRLLAAAGGSAIVAYSAEGRVLHASQDAEHLFGYRPASLVGATWEVLHPDTDFGLRLAEVADTGATVRIRELSALTRTRDELPVVVTMVPGESRDVVLVHYRDPHALGQLRREVEGISRASSQQKAQTEKEAEFLRELLRHTVETIRIGLAVQEQSSGMIAFVNEGFEAITGFSRLELLGHTFEDLLVDYPETTRRLLPYLGAIAATPLEGLAPPAAVWEVELPSGLRNIEVYGRPVGIEGHPSRYTLLLIEDDTDRQRLQNQLVQSEKLAAVGQLAAGIAHEIRNPLNTIFNALFDLSEIVDRGNKDVAEDIDISMEEIRRVQDIITNLLDFARESERSTGRTPLNEVVEKTIRLVQHDMANKHVQVVQRLEPGPDVALNNNALKQILINLITNAAQAMPDGGELRIETRLMAGPVPHRGRVSGPRLQELDAESGYDPNSTNRQELQIDPDRHVLLIVADTGMGIPPEVMAHIFNPFYTTKSPGLGTGLGLSVVHSLLGDAGGGISVQSSVGAGTSFSIELPAVRPE